MESKFVYEWDEGKRQSNLAIHGVDFASVGLIDWDKALTIDQTHKDELRHLSYAPVQLRLYALVWTRRDSKIRVISFRKANNKEVGNYEKAIG